MISIKIEGSFRSVSCMPKEYYGETLKELNVIGNCFRIVTTNSRGSCDTSTYIIKKEYLVAITRSYEGTAFLFKDMYIRIRDISTFNTQITAIIKSELEGIIETGTDLLGINT